MCVCEGDVDKGRHALNRKESQWGHGQATVTPIECRKEKQMMLESSHMESFHEHCNGLGRPMQPAIKAVESAQTHTHARDQNPSHLSFSSSSSSLFLYLSTPPPLPKQHTNHPRLVVIHISSPEHGVAAVHSKQHALGKHLYHPQTHKTK